MTLHGFNQRILAEDLVRVRRADDLERYHCAWAGGRATDSIEYGST